MSFYADYFETISRHVKKVAHADLEYAVDCLKSATQNGGRVIIVGNGGSAAMASHVSVDLTKTAQVRSVSFNEADLLTCFANDYGYERWVEKALYILR